MVFINSNNTSILDYDFSQNNVNFNTSATMTPTFRATKMNIQFEALELPVAGSFALTNIIFSTFSSSCLPFFVLTNMVSKLKSIRSSSVPYSITNLLSSRNTSVSFCIFSPRPRILSLRSPAIYSRYSTSKFSITFYGFCVCLLSTTLFDGIGVCWLIWFDGWLWIFVCSLGWPPFGMLWVWMPPLIMPKWDPFWHSSSFWHPRHVHANYSDPTWPMSPRILS